VHLVGFTIEIYYDARSYKCQICERTCLKGAVRVIGEAEPGFATSNLSEAMSERDLVTGCLFYLAHPCFKPPSSTAIVNKIQILDCV
jgi:hypothetical protein